MTDQPIVEGPQKAQKVTRIELIDSIGRTYVRNDVSVELSYQDEGRTLKVFVAPLPTPKR